MSVGKVSRTAVVCRSAPVSRSGSRARARGAVEWLKGEEFGIWFRDGKEKRTRNIGRRKASGRKKADGVPSLASTRVEGDIWSSGAEVGNNRNRYAEEGDEGDIDGDIEDGEDGPSSSEGELDLAKMLVPPKRQNSIRSLRKHLHTNGSGGRVRSQGLLASRSGTTTPAWTDWDDDIVGSEGGGDGDRDGSGSGRGLGGWRRKRGRRMDEQEEGYRVAGRHNGIGGGGESESGGSMVGKRRRGIPAAWVGQGG
jgi:hypothetical protein